MRPGLQGSQTRILAQPPYVPTRQQPKSCRRPTYPAKPSPSRRILDLVRDSCGSQAPASSPHWGARRGPEQDAGPGRPGTRGSLEENSPAGLTEEGARQEAGCGEATAARGHGRSDSGLSKGCGHPPMTLPGPRGPGRGRGTSRKRLARAFA